MKTQVKRFAFENLIITKKDFQEKKIGGKKKRKESATPKIRWDRKIVQNAAFLPCRWPNLILSLLYHLVL